MSATLQAASSLIFPALAIAQLGLLPGCGRPAPVSAGQPPAAVAQPVEARPPVRVRLKDDAVYVKKLAAALAAEPAVVASKEERLNWHLAVASAASDARAYGLAARHYRSAIDLCPGWDVLYANLSVALGKLGRYKEAEAQALTAVALGDRTAMHANMVLASWEWHLGKNQRALDRIAKVAEPTEPRERHLYHSCLACFYASVGDETRIEQAIKAALEIAPELSAPAVRREFFARDVIFDRYRGKPWFVKLVGETLAEPEAAPAGNLAPVPTAGTMVPKGDEP